MKIYLVRHGQTDWNYQKKIQGQQDVDINEQGIRQIVSEIQERFTGIFLFQGSSSHMIYRT